MVIFTEELSNFLLFFFPPFLFSSSLLQRHTSSGYKCDGAGAALQVQGTKLRDISHHAFWQVHPGSAKSGTFLPPLLHPLPPFHASSLSSLPRRHRQMTRWSLTMKNRWDRLLSASTSVPSGLSSTSQRSLSCRLLVSVALQLATG